MEHQYILLDHGAARKFRACVILKVKMNINFNQSTLHVNLKPNKALSFEKRRNCLDEDGINWYLRYGLVME